MRNDEKIDINLATEGTSENLSEEELAQQNYETALRYINIAEHMNKFEDPPASALPTPRPDPVLHTPQSNAYLINIGTIPSRTILLIF